MSFKNILVPTDGSENTKEAVRTAMEIAKISGGKVTALCVLDLGTHNAMSIPTDSTLVNYYTMLENDGKTAVNYVRDLGKQEGVEVDVSIKEGAAYQVIIDESANYDLIVMGTLGRTGMSKLLMGSVAERVVRGANCPVMAVKAKNTGN